MTREHSPLPPSLTRRGFLAATAASALAPRLLADDPTVQAAPAAPALPTPSARTFSISLAQWSLHRVLEKGGLDPLDFAPVAAREFAIRAVEYVNKFYAGKAKDEGFLHRWKQRADDCGVKSLLIMCDGEGALGDSDAARRASAVTNHHKWADAAAFLGCHSIRVNAHGDGDPEEVKKRVAESLHALADYSGPRGIDVLVENHGGWSSDGPWVADLMKQAAHSRVGTLPDFGNFQRHDGSWADRYDGVRAMMPFAKAVSAKSHEFDADGNEVGTDYRRMMKIVLDAGYGGFVGIEYEGDKHTEAEGIRKTKALLEKIRSEPA